jgi:predicted CxxxxCH...CXXCH cytochrome family protein
VPSKAKDPNVPTHLNGVDDLVWSAVAKAGSFDLGTSTCNGVYCHGATLFADVGGQTSIRTPIWTKVDGSQDVCGAACHTTPPGGGHPASTSCPTCHGDVIQSFTPGAPPTATWADATRHVDGVVDLKGGLSCTSCHGDTQKNDPAPPRGTKGELATTDLAVGAHQSHLVVGATWHRDVLCTDCHAVPQSIPHSNGQVDFSWGGPSASNGASPQFSAANATCSGVYCHGATLPGPKQGGVVDHTPQWTLVDGSQAACGKTCHTLPPGGNHPQNEACPKCHAATVKSIVMGDPPTVVWADRTKHIDGKLDVVGLECTSCHGDSQSKNPAPPLGTHGETQTSDAAVGAHARHLGASAWHRQGQCADCHAVPQSMSHSNGAVDFSWGAPSANGGATPAFVAGNLTCTGVYCHGNTLLGPKQGGVVSRTPVWTTVNGTFDACGKTCHTLPPGGNHPANDACPKCHSDTVLTFVQGDPPTVTWKDPTRHIDGHVDVVGLSCTTCHGDPQSNDPAPPLGTNGEKLTTDAAVGAHQQHLGPSNWHREGQCTDCHVVPMSTMHSDGVVTLTWGAVATADQATPLYSFGNTTCAGTYCHGSTLLGAKQGGVVARTPLWTEVSGKWDACGTTCHTNPPGPTHPPAQDCSMCHAAVVAAFDPNTNATTWLDATKHVNGVVDSNKYHDLVNWTSPKTDPNHHGRRYFLGNQQKDEHGIACAQCHGQNLDGGIVNVSCNNLQCHGGKDWRSCTFCHGNANLNQVNPPLGVADENTTGTLAVGHHTAHLTASATHLAFNCVTCHVVPPAADVAHTVEYVPSADLSTPGHHGDVTFAGGAVGTSFDATATQGAPVTARGTCLGACHSNGRGGPPVVTPYWAGGSWNAGSCGSCHAASPSTGKHGDHAGKVPCSACHPAANGGTHMNGTRDVTCEVPQMCKAPNTGFACGNRWTCTGASCHNDTHTGRCW